MIIKTILFSLIYYDAYSAELFEHVKYISVYLYIFLLFNLLNIFDIVLASVVPDPCICKIVLTPLFLAYFIGAKFDVDIIFCQTKSYSFSLNIFFYFFIIFNWIFSSTIFYIVNFRTIFS